MFDGVFSAVRESYDILNIRDRATADISRSGSQNNMFSSILGSIGGFFQKAQAADRAEEYQAKVAAAHQRANENARKIAKAQEESNLAIADFQAKLHTQNANYLKTTAMNQTKAMLQDYEKGQIVQNRSLGQAKASMVSGNIDIGSGSAVDILEDIRNVTQREINNNYFGAFNEINKTLAQKAQEETNALYTVWEAKEKNRFIDAQAQIAGY